VSAAIKDIIELEGVDVRLNAECISLAKRGDEIIAKVDCTAGAPEVAGSHLLLAVRSSAEYRRSRSRQSRGALRRAWLPSSSTTIANHSRPGVWALGDCNGKGAFTHTAYNDFEIVAANFARPRSRRVSERINRICPLYRPAIRSRRYDFGPSAHQRTSSAGRRTADDARCPRRRKGRDARIMRILVDGDSKEILGASLLGTGCDEAVHADHSI